MSGQMKENKSDLLNPQTNQPSRIKMSLSNLELYQLVAHEQKLTSRICELNLQGCQYVDEEKYEQSMAYFSEAEKTLQYAANCGKTLDRVLITTTLRNQACVYQRLWELSVCSDYLQALLLNLSCYVEANNMNSLQTKLAFRDGKFMQDFQKILNKRLMIGLTHLQLSAIFSQTGNHQAAKKAVNSSIENFKLVLEYLQKYQKIIKGKNSQLLITLLKVFEFQPEDQRIDELLVKVKKSVQRIKQHRYFFVFQVESITSLSIGDIMHITPVTVEEGRVDLQTQWFISQQGLIYQALYISCAFFTLSTESRLLHRKYNPDFMKNSQKQMIESQLLHLHSILIASDVILLDTLYLTHITKSYKNNYAIDLYSNQICVQEVSVADLQCSEHQSIKGSTQRPQFEPQKIWPAQCFEPVSNQSQSDEDSNEEQQKNNAQPQIQILPQPSKNGFEQKNRQQNKYTRNKSLKGQNRKERHARQSRKQGQRKSTRVTQFGQFLKNIEDTQEQTEKNQKKARIFKNQKKSKGKSRSKSNYMAKIGLREELKGYQSSRSSRNRDEKSRKLIRVKSKEDIKQLGKKSRLHKIHSEYFQNFGNTIKSPKMHKEQKKGKFNQANSKDRHFVGKRRSGSKIQFPQFGFRGEVQRKGREHCR